MAISGFAVRSGEETRQVQMVCVDDLVPVDDDLRRIEGLVDWDQVRRTAEPFYKAGGVGRRAVDPVVLVKLALVLAWRGLPSMRGTLRVAATDVSIRRFLGFGLTERLPDHSTFSHAQTKRFADSAVFEQLFTAVLRQCTDQGLVGGRRLLIDATHIEADAALKSLRGELVVVAEAPEGESDPDPRPDADTDTDTEGKRPRLMLAKRRSGPPPKRTASNATARSQTDPDAKLRHKPGHRTHLVHRGQVAVDPKHRVIIAVQAERATGSEADAMGPLIQNARFAGHAALEIAADSGYGSQESYATLAKLTASALIPPAPAATHPAAIAARARVRTPIGRQAANDRQAHAEGAISELKRHGATRARCRGTRLVQLQLLAAATVINLKRLLTAQDAAQRADTDHADAHQHAIRAHARLLTWCLDTITRETAAGDQALTSQTSTGS